MHEVKFTKTKMNTNYFWLPEKEELLKQTGYQLSIFTMSNYKLKQERKKKLY